MAGLSTAFLVFLFVQCLNNNGALAQYLVEILKPAAFGNNRPIFRCDATGADFGTDVLSFSFRVNYGCALPTTPANACGDVQMPLINETACNNFFAIVPRSNCSFSEKAYHVQKSEPIGFNALIVYNQKGKVPEPMSGAKYCERVNIPVVMVDYECMVGLLYRYNFSNGHVVSIKVTPGYYDLLKYLVPFGAVISFCLTLLLISLIIRVCRERRRMARKRLSRSNLKKLPVVKYKKNAGMYETCAVCLEDFVEDEKLRQLPCRHAYHPKCIDPWLTKNRKVCPICKRKVGPSNGSDSSDSDAERPNVITPLTTTSSVIVPGSTARDSVPLLNYEQPTPTSSNTVFTSLPHGSFSSGFPNLTRLSNEAAGVPPRASIEVSPPLLNSAPDLAQIRQPQSRISRFFESARSFVQRVTRADYNPHTILDNDFTSVSEEDAESNHNIITDQPTITSILSADNRALILEPLPPQVAELLQRQSSNDSEIEVLIDEETQPPHPYISAPP